MSTAQHVAKLIDVETVGLEIREDCGFRWRKTLGRLDQSASVATMAGGQLHKQADSGAHAFSLQLACLAGRRGRAGR
jgi:hypothetical protein